MCEAKKKKKPPRLFAPEQNFNKFCWYRVVEAGVEFVFYANVGLKDHSEETGTFSL